MNISTGWKTQVLLRALRDVDLSEADQRLVAQYAEEWDLDTAEWVASLLDRAQAAGSTTEEAR